MAGKVKLVSARQEYQYIEKDFKVTLTYNGIDDTSNLEIVWLDDRGYASGNPLRLSDFSKIDKLIEALEQMQTKLKEVRKYG